MRSKGIKNLFLSIVGVFAFMILPNMVNAEAWNFSYTAYNCSASDYDEAEECISNYYDETLATVGAGTQVNPGDSIMLVVKYTFDGSIPTTSFNVNVKYDNTLVTALEDASRAALDKPNPVFGTSYTNKGANKNWSDDFNDTGDMLVFNISSNTSEITDSEGTIAFAFFTVNDDATAGSSIVFDFDEDTSLADYDGNDIPSWSGTPFEFKVTGDSISTDATLKNLTSTDNNGNIITIVSPSNNQFSCNGKKCETNIVFANSVTSINLIGQTNDDKAQFNPSVSGQLTRYSTNNNLNVGNNDISFRIYSEDTSTYIDYTIHAYRLSNDARLSSMSMTNKEVGFTFDKDTIDYTSNVYFSTDVTNVTAQALHNNATIISGLGQVSLPNYGSGNENVNDISVVVNAENCKSEYNNVANNSCTSKTYTVHVYRNDPSTEARLADLRVDNKTLTGFDKDIHSYNYGVVRYAKTSATFSYTAVNKLPNANNSQIDKVEYFRVNEDGTRTKENNSTVSLNVGNNKFIVKVTAEGSSNTEEYEVTFYRNSDNDQLATLVMTSDPSGTMAPAYSDHSFNGPYVYTYESDTTNINISATTEHPNANITVNGTSYGNSIDLNVTDFTKTINIVVTAEDGLSTAKPQPKTYVINFKENYSTDNTLSLLGLTGITLNETFESTNPSYTATVDGYTNSVYVDAILSNGKAAFVNNYGPRNVDLNYGDNTIQVRVQSQAQIAEGKGAYTTYTIVVHKNQKDTKTLSGITIDGDTINNKLSNGTTFTSDVLTYTLDAFEYAKTSTTINAVVTENSDATVKYFNADKTKQYLNGVVDLSTGDNVVVIEVTAQDNTKQDYTLTIPRLKNNNANVNSVKVFNTIASYDVTKDAYVIEVANGVESVTPSDVVITPEDSNATVTKITGTINLSTKNVNEFDFEVIPENNETTDKKEYKILITRKQSTDNTLKKVSVTADSKTYTCTAFNNYACIIEVPSDTTSYTLNAETNNSEATISTIHGDGLGNYTMGGAEDSEQVKTIFVVSETGIEQSYSITIKRGKSSNADLKNIKINNAIIQDDVNGIFTKDETNYTVTLTPDSTTGITTGTIDLQAEVEDTGKAQLVVKKNTTEITLGNQSLSYGNNVYTFTVKAENGNTKTYNLTVIRSLNNNAYLSDIQIDTTSLDGFTKMTYSYNYNDEYYINLGDSNQLKVPYTKSSITINANNDDTNATYLVNGSTNHSVKLSTGENIITITGVAQDNSTTKNYTLKVYRAKNTNNQILSVTVAGKVASAEVNELGEVVGFNVTVPNTVSSITASDVIVTLPPTQEEDDPKAIVVKEGTKALSSQNVTDYTISVTPEDATVTTKIYPIHITREKSSVNTLSSLTVTNGSFSPSFSSDIDEYTVSIPAGINEVTVNYQTTDSSARVEGAGKKVLGDQSTMDVVVTVIPEDSQAGTIDHKKIYTLHLVRNASAISTLSDIKVSVGDKIYNLDKVFSPDVKTYTVEVPGGTNEVKITPTKTDNKATITNEDSYENPFSVVPGNNQFEIEVTAEASASKSTYTINVVVLNKTDNLLSDLTINGTTIQDFNPNVYNYVLNDVENNVSTIEVGATPNDADATIISTLGSKTLHTGINNIVVTVKAQNGDTQDYSITILRKKNSNADLALLSVSGAIITPQNNPFNPDVLNYRVEVESTTEKLSPNDITALPAQETTTVDKDPVLTLQTGENTYKIRTTAEDGTTKKEYTITVVRKESSDARLKQVNLVNASMNTGFTSDNLVYTLTIPKTAETFTIEGIAADENATVEGNNEYSKNVGVVIIKVTSQDNTQTKQYTFNIATAESTDATLNELEAIGYNFQPEGTAFSSTKLYYNIGEIDYGVKNINIKAIASNPNATIKYYVNDQLQDSNIVNLPQEFGEKNIKIVVTPANHVETDAKTYMITYTMASSKNNYLAKLESSVEQISPVFNKGAQSYTLSIPYETTEVSFSLATEDVNAAVSDDGSNYYYTSADVPKVFTYKNLVVGNRTFTFTVKAASQATRTYTVKVTRRNMEPSKDASLRSLSVTSHEFDKTFDSNESNYAISNVKYTGEDELVVNAVANNNSSAITYYLNGVLQTSNVIDISSTTGDNVIGVHVVAEDSITSKDYQITYNRTPSNNAYLSSMVDSLGQITNFEFDNFGEYLVSEDEDTNQFVLTLVPQDQNATISIKGESHKGTWQYTVKNISAGDTATIPITVTPESGNNPLTYTLKVSRATSTETITSINFGHVIEDGMIKTARIDETVSEMKDELDNDNSKLQLWDAEETYEITDGTMATGQIMKLIKNGEEVDRKIIVVKGDTDGNGKITPFDSVKVINHYLEKTFLTGPYLEAGDTDNNKNITPFDSVKIINHYLEKSSLFN